jgi:hypothetical protein
VTLRWLEGTPEAGMGVNWGVPWAKGEVAKGQAMVLRTSDGKAVPMQTWNLAYWPDGSVKWTGHAISSGVGASGPLTMSLTTGPVEGSGPAITLHDEAAGVEVDTGAVRCSFPKSGPNIVDAIFVGGKKVGQAGRLVVQTEDRTDAAKGVLRYLGYTSSVKKVTLEQSGPQRAVVKVEGMHAADAAPAPGATAREWLPFVMRFYFYAGSPSVRMVHSFIFDGDQQKDFIKGMGLTFDVPMVEELHNRHVRFAGDGSGVWCQPVRLLPGYRNTLSDEQYAAHLAGQRMPNMAQLNNRTAMESVAVYNDFKLTQAGPNSFSIDKRTTPSASWLHVSNGQRSLGLGVLGEVSGGLALGVKDFWQRYPASIEIRNATKDAGELTVWLWSPEGQAMDMRTYDDVPHGLQTNYEDWKPGWGTATGIAHTTDMTLWAFAAIPSDAHLAAMARAASKPPVLVCTPEYYHQQKAFGVWSLPDRSTPTLRWVEDQLDQLYSFYHGQIDERGWYGFWDYGDIMHNYDFGRHDWRYDIGGWAWANTELMPDMFLWTTFLRTGKADAYRMAEAMTRHTSETDVYHIGPFAPLGTRHNVNHWGDGAKQPRISHSMLKRYMYYLSGGDERLGDLMDEQVDADLTYAKLQQFNGSHYVPTGDGTFRLDGNTPAPRPEEMGNLTAPPGRGARGGAAFPQTYADGKPMEPRYANAQFNLEWICYSIDWSTKWERTGDPIWRDRVLAGMKTIVARSNGGPLGQNYFDIIFGGPEILFDEKQMYDYPEFWDGFAKVCEAVSNSNGNQMTAPRGAAYAASVRQSQQYGSLAWEKLVGTANPNNPIPQNVVITTPNVLHPVTDPVFLGRSDGWQLHGVASIQWALNAIETTELAKPYLRAWEAARGIKPQAAPNQ